MNAGWIVLCVLLGLLIIAATAFTILVYLRALWIILKLHEWHAKEIDQLAETNKLLAQATYTLSKMQQLAQKQEARWEVEA